MDALLIPLLGAIAVPVLWNCRARGLAQRTRDEVRLRCAGDARR